jgi:hypothetical protein
MLLLLLLLLLLLVRLLPLLCHLRQLLRRRQRSSQSRRTKDISRINHHHHHHHHSRTRTAATLACSCRLMHSSSLMGARITRARVTLPHLEQPSASRRLFSFRSPHQQQPLQPTRFQIRLRRQFAMAIAALCSPVFVQISKRQRTELARWLLNG